jgi:hypothetical protein
VLFQVSATTDLSTAPDVVEMASRLLNSAAEYASENAEFEKAELLNAEFENAEFENAELENAEFENAELLKAELEKAEFENAELLNAELENAAPGVSAPRAARFGEEDASAA